MSVAIYSRKDEILVTTWCPEVFGFIWGIVLANDKKHFCNFVKKRWLFTSVCFGLVSGVLGLSYLKYKPVAFYGDYLLKILLGVSILTFILSLNVRISIANKASLFLGKISYEVYLLHGTVFGLTAYFIPESNSGVFIALSILMTIVLSWGIHCASTPVINGLSQLMSYRNGGENK